MRGGSSVSGFHLEKRRREESYRSKAQIPPVDVFEAGALRVHAILLWITKWLDAYLEMGFDVAGLYVVVFSSQRSE